jgi:ClpX C4-type zinc finger
MMSNGSAKSNADLTYLVHCCVAISDRRYGDALALLRSGVTANLNSAMPIDGREILKKLCAVVACLDMALVEDFPSSQGKDYCGTLESEAITCSFCGGSRSDNLTIIAGPDVYTCESCIRICHATLETTTQKP